MARKKIIIGIHGLGNKPPEALLEKWWRLSIEEGLTNIGSGNINVPFEIVYWADVLHPQLLDPEIKESDNPLYLDEPYVEGHGKVNTEENALRIKLLSYLESQIDTIFLNDDLTINFKNVTDKFIHKYFQDLDAYYRADNKPVEDPDCSAKNAIQNRLLNILKKYKKCDVMLISHSMGSIVAFDVLWKYSGEVKVNTFITIGSPLGLPVIVARVFAEQKNLNKRIKKPQAPDSVTGKWFNFSDLEDQVALDHTLADDYGLNNNGFTAEDFTVINDYKINDIRNPHKSFGYLRTPEFAVVVNEFLSRKKKFEPYNYLTKKIIYSMDIIKNILKGSKNEPK